MDAARQHALEELPPSAKLVYKVLAWNGKLTQKGIVEETMLPARTVRYALNRLKKTEIVTEEFYIPDARQNIYSVCKRELPSP